ncbi:MAG: hypothetical protein H8D87_14220 [Deltaproteobacteria bacterium]|uniref:type II toxin-antitoxin system HicB family antitoxin n=1 Tax=Desulfobacula sp. TaxID=2593537 RepID=UPI00199DC736|nr:hypothetical protein [Candidatus Desulfobacula maris]MBL6995495.1 hypothetical protein [Desulfobacula sp.]
MAELIKKNKDISFTVNVLTKKEDGMFVAHCLELDIVAVGNTIEEVQKDIVSTVCAQIDYAFSNDNLDNLFHPAPPEAWQEFYKCKEQIERKYPIRSSFTKARDIVKVPPWLTTNFCNSEANLCHA